MILRNSVSVVMPYWRRQDALDQTLVRYRQFYGDHIEIIVVDDGSPEPAETELARLIRLPQKTKALNPCVPINIGVAASTGELIVITNPEVLPRAPFLDLMVRALDDADYVAAACWNEASKTWYCHSTLAPPPAAMGRAPIPDGAGLHFCAMLPRSVFGIVGGFCEEYRNGQGYEDNDFLWKLYDGGIRFRILDDCVTDHIAVPPSEWTRSNDNRALFESRWPNL